MTEPFISAKHLFIPCRENGFRPTFLDGELAVLLATILVFLKIINVYFWLYLPASSLFTNVAKIELVDLTNQTRQNSGLAPLNINPLLERAALLKAQDMLKNNYFAHTSPSGATPWYWFSEAGYKYQSAGENLAAGFIDTNELMQAWRNSPSHLANILNPKYKEIGMAVIRGNFQGGNTALVVQLFGSPAKSSSTTVKTVVKSAAANSEKIIQKPVQKESITTATASSSIATQKTVLGEEKTTPEEKNLMGALAVKISDIGDNTSRILAQVLLIILLVVLTLTLAIAVQIGKHHPDLIHKTLIMMVVVSFLLLFNKGILISLLPHNILI